MKKQTTSTPPRSRGHGGKGTGPSEGAVPSIPFPNDDSPDLFRELAETVREVFWVRSRDRILYISPRFEEVYGLSCQSMYKNPRSFIGVIHEADRDRVALGFEEEMAVGVFDQEYRIKRSDGTLRWIRARSFPVKTGEHVLRTVGIAEDITEQKLLEESLLQENAFHTAIIDSITDGLCVCHDIDEAPGIRFTIWNDRMREITGYTMEEINRLGWHQVECPDEPALERVRLRMDSLRKGSGLHGDECTIRRSDGTRRIVEVTASIIQGKGGVQHIMAAMHDVTEKKQGEETLRKALDMLEKQAFELERQNRGVESTNAALKVLLQQRDQDREELRQSFLSNLRHLVLPQLAKLREASLPYQHRMHYCDLIEMQINEMASPLIWELSNKFLHLTPAELRTAELIKRGKSTKDVAKALGIAPSTVNTHREALRRKLGITGKKTNLTTFLRTLR